MNDENNIMESVPCAYYDIRDIGSKVNGSGNLIVFHHNIRSFNKNFDNLTLLIDQIKLNIDVLVLTETWFVDGLCWELQGYVGHHVVRADRGGGGVSVFIRSDLQCTLNTNLTSICDSYEICAVEVIPDADNRVNNLTILGTYRPPTGSIILFTEHLETVFTTMSNRSVVLCGDINVDLLDQSSADIFNSFYSYNFLPFINLATRITETTAKCLDQIWYNKLNVSFAGAIISDITDHYPVFVILEMVNTKNPVTIQFRDHSEDNMSKLYSDMQSVRDVYFVECASMSVSDKCSWFIERLWVAYSRACPKKTKTLSVKKLLKPWINNEIRRMVNYKHHLFKEYKSHNIPFEEYNRYKNNLNSKLRKSKRAYYMYKFNNCRNNQKQTWKTINNLLSKVKSKPNNVTLLDEHGVEAHNSDSVANIFCSHYSTIADKLDTDIPRTTTDPLSFMPDPVTTDFSPSPATDDEVIKVIDDLKDKPCNVNNIPICIFKRNAIHIAPVISDIFNTSLIEGTFPTALKLARIIPIHKGKDRKLVNNYRPISLLPIISKLLEKIFKIKANAFINDNNILYSGQYGFRRGCSTTDAILHYVNDCTTALDSRLYTITIFLDFSKAFDTVNKDIMLGKLDRLGFRNVTNDFLRSYLTDRRMYVSINGCESTTKTTNIGLPQGSVSSPWLFSLYINDMHRTSTKFKFIHFADDTTIYMSGKDLTRLCEDVCHELTVIDDWLKANRLSLNIDKTCYMIHTHNRFDVHDCDIRIRDTPIKYVKTTKFLGLTIDDRLNYNEHVSILCKTLSKTKGLLYKLSFYVPRSIIRKMYYALFYSRMSYSISVWGGGNITNINKISQINRSAINTFNSNVPVHGKTPLSSKAFYKQNCLCLFHKYLHDVEFLYFNSLIKELVPSHNRETRFVQSFNFSYPAIFKTVSQHQFLFNAIKLWNSLPLYLKTISCNKKFKYSLKLHLIAGDI